MAGVEGPAAGQPESGADTGDFEGGEGVRYKVSYSGFYYVEADSPEEAAEKAVYEDAAIYNEVSVEKIEEVDEFSVRLEG